MVNYILFLYICIIYILFILYIFVIYIELHTKLVELTKVEEIHVGFAKTEIFYKSSR